MKAESGGKKSPRQAAQPAISVGMRAPDFTVPCVCQPDPERRAVSLADYRDRWLILLFYPRDFSMVCPTELTALSRQFDQFVRRDCGIVGVSTDSLATDPRRRDITMSEIAELLEWRDYTIA